MDDGKRIVSSGVSPRPDGRSRRLVQFVACGLLVLVVAASCGTNDENREVQATAPTNPTGSSDGPVVFPTLEEAVRTWPNMTGVRVSVPLEEWSVRIDRACDAPVWDEAAGRQLAAEFLAADGGDATSDGMVASATQALWLIAVQVCHDDFPADVLAAGPPGFG